MTKLSIALVTAPSMDVAAPLARTLVDERLCACVNLMPIRSIYEWEGAAQDQAEVLLMIKLRRGGFERLRARVAGLHPYEVPEIIAFDVTDAHSPYAAWIAAQTDAPAKAKPTRSTSAKRR